MKESGEPRSERDRLLELTVDYVLDHGVAQLTLRGVARAVGSNNRMLLYYFGSKEQLLVEVLRQADRRFPRFVSAIDELRHPSGDLRTTLRLVWAAIIDPESRAHIRLFFEIFGLAVHQPEVYDGLLASVSTEWVELVGALVERAGVESPQERRALARGLVSVWRGLEMDLLGGEAPAQVEAVGRSAIDVLWANVEELVRS